MDGRMAWRINFSAELRGEVKHYHIQLHREEPYRECHGSAITYGSLLGPSCREICTTRQLSGTPRESTRAAPGIFGFAHAGSIRSYSRT